MIEKLQHRYALSERGAKDLVQASHCLHGPEYRIHVSGQSVVFLCGRSFGWRHPWQQDRVLCRWCFVLPGADLRDHILAV